MDANVLKILDKFSRVANDPNGAAKAWKEATGGKVVGTFAMHFPAEVVHAAGALPVLLQSDEEQITEGHGGMYPFFCGYTRSLVDQNIKGKFDYLDCIMFGDHCVQLLSAADVIRIQNPSLHVGFYQLIPALKDNWSFENAERTLIRLKEAIEGKLGATISDDSLRNSICVFNKNRQLIRRLYELRRDRRIRLSAVHMQAILKSSMVMDKAEHNSLLAELVASLERNPVDPTADGSVPLYLSGHLCHATKPRILELIESCGATVVDDDLYHGFRYVSIDAAESGDPIKSLTSWYLDRNTVVPCPTRLDPKVDWDGWLLEAVKKADASGLVVLMPKFCEPHYFSYPRIKKTFEAAQFPHLRLETEHEFNAYEGMRVRVESFLEMIKHRQAMAAV
ncbi:MAG: 2-hydroxyacyl-CoA dehydratase family protein [Porticoccaceae bacterium]|nr:2-hydroxyacyl-CoA dehydratase family protein [Porticoccaceae bacterium]